MELKERKKAKQRIPSTCHPEQLAVAKGLCRNCYSKQLKQNNPDYLEKQRQNCKDWSERNRDRKLQTDTDYHLRRNYGISLNDYNKMFEEQGGLCSICQKPPANGRRLDVDHNHETQEVRGLLCTSCNRVCGYLDNKEWLKRAMEYLGIDNENKSESTKVTSVSSPVDFSYKECGKSSQYPYDKYDPL